MQADKPAPAQTLTRAVSQPATQTLPSAAQAMPQQRGQDAQRQEVTSLTAATANVLNLALPNRHYYANQDPYSERDYRRKIDWLGGRIAALNADVLTVQEVWDEAALQDAVKASGLR